MTLVTKVSSAVFLCHLFLKNSEFFKNNKLSVIFCSKLNLKLNFEVCVIVCIIYFLVKFSILYEMEELPRLTNLTSVILPFVSIDGTRPLPISVSALMKKSKNGSIRGSTQKTHLFFKMVSGNFFFLILKNVRFFIHHFPTKPQ